MIDSQLLADTVAHSLEGTDAFVVDIAVGAGNNIVVEIDSFTNVDIDTCARITRDIEAVFDRDVEDYDLEVGSAGFTSPFKVPAQYEKNLGNEVEVLTADGRKLTGVLVELSPDASSFVIEVTRKVKLPDKKRPETVTEPVKLAVADCKYVKYNFQFK